MLAGNPAFILGNGPQLPVDDLDCLADRFTIGVNRVVRVFAPTVVLWVDRSVYDDVGERIDGCGALAVCDRQLRRRRDHVGLKTRTGEDALVRASTPEVLCCNGNTGCCAARWALALNCRPVYLLGMEAQYRDGRTDFYGVNPRHRREGATSTLAVMRKELDRLLRDAPGKVLGISDGQTLRELAAQAPRVDQHAAREHIRDMLRKRAVDVC
jgi:hypothetical protein